MRAPERTCGTCGSGVGRGMRFCNNCGTPLGDQAERAMPPVVRRLLAQHHDHARAAWFHLGAVLLGQNRHAEARSALDSALVEPGTTPSDAEIGVLRAWALTDPDDPSVALQAYLEASLLDPLLAEDILPAAEELLSAGEARVLGPWIRSTWLPGMRAASGVDTAALELFHTKVLALMGDAEAATALADVLRAGMSPDALAARPDAPLPEAEWALLIATALARLGETDTARRFVARARSGQLPESGPFGAAEALVLEADLTADAGEADARRYEAASLFAGRGEHDRAVELFERAAVSWGDSPELHWTWADSIRLATYGNRDLDPAETHRRIMARWSAGTALADPDESSSWAFLVPAFACENYAWTDPARPRDQLWQACLWAERTLVFEERNMPALLLLGRCHRQLENYGVAAVSVRAAVEEQDEGVTDASDEYASLLGFVDPDHALDALTRSAETTGDDQRARWTLALLRAQSGREAEAAENLELLTPDPGDPWQMWAYGWVLRMLGRDEEAAVWFTRLRQETEPDDSWTWCRAYAAYALGEHDAAATELSEALGDVDRTSNRRHDYLVLIGLARLAQGRADEGEPPLREAAGLITTRRDALDAVADLRALAARAGDGAAAGMIEVFQRRADELGHLRLDVDDALAELNRVAGDDVAAVAARATLARLSLERRVTDAFDAYRWLLGKPFPEAAIGLFRAGITHADAAIDASEPSAVIERLERLRGVLAGRDDPRLGLVDMNLNAREALAAFWLGDVERGRTRLAESVVDIETFAASAGAEIASFWAGLVPNPQAYWAIADVLATVEDQEVRVAAEHLSAYLDGHLGTDRDDPVPAFPSCELWLGAGLVPFEGLDGSRLAGEVLVTTYGELEAELGLPLPFVTVSEDGQLAPYELRLDLWGTVMGSVAVDPDAPDLQAAVGAGFADLLRANARVLVNVDMIVTLRVNWLAESPELADRVPEDSTVLLALTRVVRGLVEHGVPVTDGRAVLSEFTADAPVEEIVDRCARRLAGVPEALP